MTPAVSALIVVAALLFVVAYGVGALLGKRGEPMRDWVSMHTRHRKRRGLVAAELPAARPIEQIAADLRRLGGRFHALHPGASYAKVEAVRSAYDRVLTECCASLAITHLLGVLGPGAPRDAERERVEELIASSGVRLPYAA